MSIQSAADCVAAEVANAETQWSLGTFGAIAEFARDDDESVELTCKPTTGCSAVTARGGLCIVPHSDMRLFAFETTTKESWSSRVALCLPRDRCAMSGRDVLTELGPDVHALRPQDRSSILFDLGIGALQVDACIRISDSALAGRLRQHCGHPTFASDNPAGGLILAHSPHRVFISRIGRIEVFQPIPPPDGRSPSGPHTHVLLDLLRHRRTHAATEPIPDELVPCAHLYPAHPAKDAQGRSRPFDPQRLASFQAMLRQFGDPQSIAIKERVRQAIAAGEPPSIIPVSKSRFARTDIRVALRQLRLAEQDLPSLNVWTTAHEPAAPPSGEDDHYGHHR